MTKKKTTKRALLMSVLSLMMCVTMFVGSTFAWFTDEVTSAGNIIKSGTLDVTMEWKDATTTGKQLAYKDASLGAIFNYDLWEPGYVEAKNIKISNIGTLALKYQLNIAATGTVSKLADVIDVYYADGEVALAEREDMSGFTKLGKLTDVLTTISTTASGNLLATESHTVTLALKMQETAGNEYQGLAIGSEFAVQLLATQLTSEFDSFDNQYDAEAAWDGTIPDSKPDTLVVDTEKKLISINDVAAFAYLNTLVENESFRDAYGSTWQYTIELNTDVNLMGKAWTPIVLQNFVGFDGNGHTISNLYVSTANKNAGLFGIVSSNDSGNTYIKDFTIDGASVNGNKSVGAVIGSGTNAAVSNVTVNNANVTGIKYVGGIFGSGNGDANNCTVKNSTIMIDQIVIDPEDNSIDSKEAAGLIGYVSNDGHASTTNKVIAGNTVENVTITAPTIASGLVAQPNSSNSGGAKIEIKNNTMKNVTIITTEDATANLYVSNNVGGKSIVKDNTAVDCKAGREVYGLKVLQAGNNTGTIIVDSKEALLNLGKLKAEWANLFSNGLGTDYSNYAPQNGGAGTDYYYHWGWTVELTSDIDFGGAEIAPIDLGQRSVFDGHNHTIKNAVIKTDSATENEAGLFVANSCGVKNLKLDNIQVTGSNVGNSTAGVLSGSCNSIVENITITNSSVTGGKYTGGVIGYGYTKILNCTLTNVTVKGGYKLGGLIGYICASGTNTGDVTGNTLTDCTVDGIGGGVYAGGKDKYIIGKVVGNYNCNGTCNNNTTTNMTTSAVANIGEIEAGKVVTQ